MGFFKTKYFENINTKEYKKPVEKKKWSLLSIKLMFKTVVHAKEAGEDWKKYDYLIFNPELEPEKEDFVLIRKWDGTYRICECKYASTDSLPNLYDGNETPGVGYDFIGTLEDVYENI